MSIVKKYINHQGLMKVDISSGFLHLSTKVSVVSFFRADFVTHSKHIRLLLLKLLAPKAGSKDLSATEHYPYGFGIQAPLMYSHTSFFVVN